ncbi:MAG TPA: DUF218 domain-containing protein [Anaerolineae bacterium]|nr:DUF218 domain-containing protein [Anaerolineae bacterium]
MTITIASAISILILIAILIPNLITSLSAKANIGSIEDVLPHKVAIVFGAGLWRDGTPTPVLRDRIETAAELYFQGKVEKILMSGDNRFIDYNEPGAMKQYAISLGIPGEDIVLDFAGRRTYDTCYRAKNIFGIDNAILVTQKFHLPRALYICKQLGIKVTGITADRRVYSVHSSAFWRLREFVATSVALWEVHVSKPVPVLGKPEPITSAEDKGYL